jgi:MoxR-like ATPase
MNPELTATREMILAIESDLGNTILGQSRLIRILMIVLFAWGHILIEWVPWLGKTKTIRTLASILGLDTKRISFTPDLLPSDLTGTEIYRPQKGEFSIRKWPIFTNILIADEINRTPPKVQSALLEAMEERCVTIGDTSLPLPDPFFTFATQNPLEHEGTYPLPEAQLDRFILRIIIGYPDPKEEGNILRDQTKLGTPKIHPHPLTAKDILDIQNFIAENIRIDDKIYEYITAILQESRRLCTETIKVDFGKNPSGIHIPPLSYGASTRAGLAFIKATKVRALLEGRDFVMPEDIKHLAHDILDHRMGLSYEAISENISVYDVTEKILNTVRIP